jgi:predicted nucleic acid-binding protein
MPFVLDASVTLAWCFDDEQNPAAERAIGSLSSAGDGLVPGIWLFEVANALVGAQRRQRLDEPGLARVRGLLSELPLTVAPMSIAEALGPVADLARTHGLSAYDASYLYVAMREGVPLATIDGQLRDAAGRAGLPLMG